MKRLLNLLALTAFAGSAHAQGLTKSVGGAATPAEDAAPVAALAVENHRFYIGADYSDFILSVSNPDAVGGYPQGKYTTKFLDARVGYRVLDAVGLEFHYGAPLTHASDDGERIRSERHYGIFVVPTASVFETFELAFPIGYTWTTLRRNVNGASVKTDQNSVAFGVNIEIPIRVLWDKLPDFRLTGGGSVNVQHPEARYYGFHYGLRYDFGL